MGKENKDKLVDKFLKEKDFADKYYIYKGIDTDKAFSRFCDRVGIDVPVGEVRVDTNKKVIRRALGWRAVWNVAASLVLLVGGFFGYKHFEEQRQLQATVKFLETVSPGRHCAYMTTDDGREAALTGEAAAVDTVAILSQADGADAVLSTVTVPRGGEYRLILSDGTVVYLNSESSLTFPNRFGDTSRKVSLAGEAYFEVAHSDAPFVVHANNVSVKQYGTKFNVQSYSSECTEITLVQGSIGVTVGNSGECVLTPGRQARVVNDEVTICNADIESVTGWKDGFFRFDNASLADMATVLSRWYDVDIKVNPSHAGNRFTGSLMRDESLSDILDAIGEITNTTYSVHGNAIEIHK